MFILTPAPHTSFERSCLLPFLGNIYVFVLAGEDCVVKVEWTRKSLRFFGSLYVTRGGLGTFTKCL